ncbi:MAG: hypothetical protein AAF242_14855 [Bacteroidota bacterium]
MNNFQENKGSKNKGNQMIAMIILYLFLLPWCSFSQNLAEQLLVHTDRSAYISGETVWLSVANLLLDQEQVSTFSQVVYVDMHDPSGQAVAQAKLSLEAGRAVGNLELAKGLRSGLYTIRAYTQAMFNFAKPVIYEQEVFVLNPQEPLILPVAEQVSNFKPQGIKRVVSDQQALSIDITPNTNQIGQRSLCTIKISTKDNNGNPTATKLSLSVAKKAPGANAILEKSASYPSRSLEDSKTQILAEDRGMRLSGKVINEQSQSGEPNVEVFIAFPGKRSVTYSAITDQTGQFSVILPKLYGLRQVVVQFTEREGIPLKLSLDNPFQAESTAKNKVIQLSPEWLAHLQDLMINTQVGQAYESFSSPDQFIAATPYEGISFFGRPERQYILDNYTRFPIPEFFYEVVPEVRVRGKFGEERISIISDLGSSASDVPPLMLVDGVPVFDQEVFLKINNKLIESIEIITDPVWLNPGFFNGMVQLSSFEGDARSFDLPATALRQSFLTFLPEKQFAAPSYETTDPNSSLPDFRNTLYWNPQVETDENGQATIQFYTSDALGDYEVKVLGVSERGQLGEGSKVIEVRKQ